MERTGPVSYRVQVDDLIWRRHVDQILDRPTPGCSVPTDITGTAIGSPELPTLSGVVPSAHTDPHPGRLEHTLEDWEAELAATGYQSADPHTPSSEEPQIPSPVATNITPRYPQREHTRPDRLTIQW